jgi:hypothetical protein
MKKTLLIPALLLLAAAAAQTTAQTTPAQTKNPVSSALRDILPGRQKNTIAAVEAMPADKFNYKPSADQMTFGHLVAHMVEANYAVCSGAAAVTAPKVEEVKETDTKDKLVAALKASFDFCADALSKMDDSKLTACGASLIPEAKKITQFTGIICRLQAWRWERASSGKSKMICGSRIRSWPQLRDIRFIND